MPIGLIQNCTTYALQVMRANPITFYVDCPTSKAKVVYAAIAQIGAKLEQMKLTKFCLYVPCGARLDLVHGVKNNFGVNFGPEAGIFVVQQHAGGCQTTRSVPTYAVVLTSPDFPLKNVPAHVETNKCRASAWEALRLRCVDAKCPHLPAVAAAQANTAGAAPAVVEPSQFLDDAEPEADGDTLAIEEDNSGALVDAELELLDTKDILKKAKQDPKDVFCLAKPLDHYRKVLTTVLKLTSGKLAVITRTAHPGLLVAARALGLEVLVCVEDCPPHSKGHGDELMLRFWKQLKWAQAEAATKPKEVKNVANSDLTFLMALAPEQAAQMVQARPPRPKCFLYVPLH